MKENKPIPTTIRFEPETLEMIQEIQSHFVNNQSGAVNFAVKEFYNKIFKQEHA